MSQWMTAQEIAERYIVGEERLAMYSNRGNLAFRRAPDGQVLFEESTVALFFRPRVAHVGSAHAGLGANASLGVLGVSRLGERTPATMTSGRDARKRAARILPAAPVRASTEQKKATG